MEQIASTTEWTDAVHAYYRTRGLKKPDQNTIRNPPPAHREEILFSVLRSLHARQAEELVGVHWSLPTGERVRLLEDADLRTAFGKSIGRIAHSHHWSIERVDSDLRDTVGAAPGMPPEWTVNEKLIACMLRCADAAHIDHRRAPSMLYALSKPKGTSEKHWRFQHKLNKATRSDGALLFSSGEDFAVEEASAWWLCFDTIKMIDGELSSASALLQDIGRQSFAATRVYGAESTRVLAKYIRPNGWRPVDADILVQP